MSQEENGPASAFPSRRTLLLGSAAIIGIGAIGVGAMAKRSPTPTNTEIVVYKTPTCGCCGAWVQHVRDAGLDVKTKNLSDLSPIREQYGAPIELAACHIAIADGYVVEGHIPASAIKRLLAERPDAVGIFVPGMPLGSPGMESPHGSDRYDVILLRHDGSREVFASFGA